MNGYTEHKANNVPEKNWLKMYGFFVRKAIEEQKMLYIIMAGAEREGKRRRPNVPQNHA